MSNFNLITTIIIPKFLKKTTYEYVLIGGKAYQYYFKDIKSDDWDLILDGDPNKFLEELRKELNKHNIVDIELSSAKGINGEKIFQMGLKSYKGPDYEDRFFIDIKQGKIKTYNPIKFSGIMIASLEYLYKDGLKTLSDRKILFKKEDTLFKYTFFYKNDIKYLNDTIKLNVKSNYDIILKFYRDILPTFKVGSDFKKESKFWETFILLENNLKTFLTTFINYYGNRSIKKNEWNSIKTNKELEKTFDDLYIGGLYKYHTDIKPLKGKPLELYNLISSIIDLKCNIKLNIKSNFKIIINFYIDILPSFKDGSELKENLDKFLTAFINYYGNSILTKNEWNSIKTNKELEKTYDKLYNSILFLHHTECDIKTIKGKKLELYKLITSLEEFNREIKEYNNRKTIIKGLKKSYEPELKKLTIKTDRIKTKYFKSFRRKQAIMDIITDTRILNKNFISILNKNFIRYIKSNCKTNVFIINLEKDKNIIIPCKKHSRKKLSRRYSTSTVMNKHTIRGKISKLLKTSKTSKTSKSSNSSNTTNSSNSSNPYREIKRFSNPNKL